MCSRMKGRHIGTHKSLLLYPNCHKNYTVTISMKDQGGSYLQVFLYKIYGHLLQTLLHYNALIPLEHTAPFCSTKYHINYTDS
jgi:hypothetical protein